MPAFPLVFLYNAKPEKNIPSQLNILHIKSYSTANFSLGIPASIEMTQFLIL